MCGRYTIFTDADEKELFDIISAANLKYGNGDETDGVLIEDSYAFKTGEIFPGNTVPTLKLSEAGTGMSVSLQKWGVKNSKGSLVINARRETVLEKPLFRDSFLQRRIVIPSTGFYEWTHDENVKKQKYLFNLPDTRVLYMGGIWREVDGIENFVILTGEANGSISDVHNRMPLIICKNNLRHWLGDTNAAIELITSPISELVKKAV